MADGVSPCKNDKVYDDQAKKAKETKNRQQKGKGKEVAFCRLTARPACHVARRNEPESRTNAVV
jgi:hypothetical protein